MPFDRSQTALDALAFNKCGAAIAAISAFQPFCPLMVVLMAMAAKESVSHRISGFSRCWRMEAAETWESPPSWTGGFHHASDGIAEAGNAAPKVYCECTSALVVYQE